LTAAWGTVFTTTHFLIGFTVHITLIILVIKQLN
jgi:hypothetical protein